jgi:MFS transporter, NNP family, nitrate/nitrite transporter
MQRDHTTDVPSKKRLLNERLDAGERAAPSLRAQLGPVSFLAVLFFLNFVSRIILSPLLPTIEKELAINHSQAGFLFFLSSGGYLVGLLSSGLLAARASHRWAIVISGAGVGMAMLSIASAQNLSMIRCGLFGVGFSAGLYMPSAIATITALVDKRH